jgi:hypothetical protein
MRALFVLLLLAGCGDTSPYDLDGGDLLLVGKKFVDKRGCPTCHQSPDPADGTLSGSLTPVAKTMAYPANLTPDVDTGIGTWADITVIRAIRFGVDDEQLPLCNTMPLFEDMTDLEANAIVAYLRSLPPVHREIPASECKH